MNHTTIQTPIGPLFLAADGEGLRYVHFQNGHFTSAKKNFAARPEWIADGGHPTLVKTIRQLEEYFAGERQDFDLPLAPQGTPFQRRVWDALLEIPWGQTRSYGHIAARIGEPKAARAVGLANGSNPLPIVIPCHRVIGANGKLVGFGGGLDIKEKLLAIETAPAAIFA